MEMLSEYPSEAILQALEDLEWCENNPRYKVCMGYWHSPSDIGCHVNLWGCVITRRHAQGKWDKSLHPVDFCKSLGKLYNSQIISIDEIPHYKEVFLHHWIDSEEDREHLLTTIETEVGDIPLYHIDKDGYKKGMRKIAKVLDREGY